MKTSRNEDKSLPLKRNNKKAEIVERFLAAADNLMQTHRYKELTDKKISAAANSNDAMLHYYFGGKEGLIFEIFVRHNEAIEHELEALDALDASLTSVTRSIFDILTEAYLKKPWLTKLLIAEMAQEESVLKELYLRRYKRRGVGVERLRITLARLANSGVFKKDLNIDHATRSVMSVIFGAVMMSVFMDRHQFDLSVLRNDDWLNYVSNLFENQFKES